MVATGLIRERWLDSVAAAPPLLVWIGFKIWMSKTSEQEFRYYVPTAEEAEAERFNHENEKRTRHSEMEKRFLHPALQADKLFTVMVHKEQEQLAREVLSAYPWFNKVKAVREVRRLCMRSKRRADQVGEPRVRPSSRRTFRCRSTS